MIMLMPKIRILTVCSSWTLQARGFFSFPLDQSFKARRCAAFCFLPNKYVCFCHCFVLFLGLFNNFILHGWFLLSSIKTILMVRFPKTSWLLFSKRSGDWKRKFCSNGKPTTCQVSSILNLMRHFQRASLTSNSLPGKPANVILKSFLPQQVGGPTLTYLWLIPAIRCPKYKQKMFPNMFWYNYLPRTCWPTRISRALSPTLAISALKRLSAIRSPWLLRTLWLWVFGRFNRKRSWSQI